MVCRWSSLIMNLKYGLVDLETHSVWDFGTEKIVKLEDLKFEIDLI